MRTTLQNIDAEIHYYEDGVATYAKLVYCNGHYYYIGSSLKAVRDTTHWVSATNGLMEAGSYTFEAQGRMIDPPEDALTEAISTFALSGETMSKTYDYVYASGKLMRQVLTVTIGDSTTTYTMDFFYDASGYPFAVKYNGALCYYITNLQGDAMSIVDAQGEVVAEYEYDPYGNIVSQSGPLADVNPLRYRGYVYDTETQFYYLQSRYYDPNMCRFINADSYVSTGQGVLGNNMFAYCRNNPVCRVDISGTTDADYMDTDPLDDMFGQKDSQGGSGPSSWDLFLQCLDCASSGLRMAAGDRRVHAGTERHHVVSDKSKIYTPQYKEITDRYNYSLSQQENIIDLGNHKGRHTNAYHEFILTGLKAADVYAGSDSAKFTEAMLTIAKYIENNPWLPYARKGGK